MNVNLWEMPEVTGVNRLPARAMFIPFQAVTRARTFDRNQSPWFKQLSGVWKFRLFDSPAAAKNFFQCEAADNSSGNKITTGRCGSCLEKDGWVDMPVPSSWQLQGVDDWPV